MNMTHRERFYKVVQHEQADRAVFDLEGSPQTHIDYPETRDGISKLLGINNPNHTPLQVMILVHRTDLLRM